MADSPSYPSATVPADTTGVLGLSKITAGLKSDNALLAPDGLVSAPAYSFSASTDIGWYRNLSNVHLAYSGVRRLTFDLANNAVALSADGTIAWSNTSGDASTTRDVVLARDAANTLAQRNGANAQTHRVYISYTDASNYDRFQAYLISAGEFRLVTQKAGTGAGAHLEIGTEDGHGLYFLTNNTLRWTVNSSGHFVTQVDSTYDIGQSGSTRPRDYFAGRDYVSPTGSTSATTGFIYIPSGAGTPTGVPSKAAVGVAPLYYDTTAKKIWVYDQPSSTWKGVVVA